MPEPALRQAAGSGITAAFCEQLLEQARGELPQAAADAARRSLLNVLGTTIGAARSDAVEALLATARDCGGDGDVVVPGRAETVDPHWGALLIGTAAHYDDFDDTHLATVIHPGAATLATLLALDGECAPDGATALTAFALGIEAQLRIGNSISPNHYDRGWHITGTCGVFGSAVAAGILLGLDAAELERALGLAALMVLGHREAFGSMTKPLHPGKAAVNGTIAARLARAGVQAPADPLASGRALTGLADDVDHEWLAKPLTGAWEIERNTFKPYPCGIVAHPLIDAAIKASEQLDGVDSIVSVQVVCNRLVPELMGRLHPQDGLQARFSSYHATAVGLLDGRVGLAQFSDERATAEDARAVRDMIELLPAADCPRDGATVRVQLRDGAAVIAEIEHARGSRARPLTDEELNDKVKGLVEPILGAEATARIAAAVDELAGARDLDSLLTAITPGAGS